MLTASRPGHGPQSHRMSSHFVLGGLVAVAAVAAVGFAVAGAEAASPTSHATAQPTNSTSRIVAPAVETPIVPTRSAPSPTYADHAFAPHPSVQTTPAPAAVVAVAAAARPVRATTATAAPRHTGTAGATSNPTTPTTPARVLFGVATARGTQDLGQLDTFNSAAGKKAALFSYYNDFSSGFDAGAADAVRARGAQPMITWEPWDPSNGSVNQPAYSLAAIAGGRYDSYIVGWAHQVKAWGHALTLRFAHEMNANWYPWDEGVNGNTPGQYVAAWRHVHDLFAAAGVSNVSWVWSPNVVDSGTTALTELYPGDAYVDWLGVDGYNWGTTQSWSGWQSFTDVFGATLAQLRGLSKHQIMIGETASAEQGGSKADWIRGLFSGLASNNDIRAFVWFNLDKETDWTIQSSSAAQAAFAAGVADSRYQAG
ncbi:MAG: glycoside hydrolase family 26 protein [Acidimicrobiales bacterium]